MSGDTWYEFRASIPLPAGQAPPSDLLGMINLLSSGIALDGVSVHQLPGKPGLPPEFDQLLARAVDLTADLFEILTEVRPDAVPQYLLDAQKRALLDTVATLDDGDADPVQLTATDAAQRAE